MSDPIVETWQINHRINLYLLDALTPEALTSKLPSARTRTVARLHQALVHSGEAMAEFIQRSLIKGKIPGFKPHPIAFLGYLISHESYHRGEICVALTESGHELDDKILYGQWEWDKR